MVRRENKIKTKVGSIMERGGGEISCWCGKGVPRNIIMNLRE
jgi:hypothetical protein